MIVGWGDDVGNDGVALVDVRRDVVPQQILLILGRRIIGHVLVLVPLRIEVVVEHARHQRDVVGAVLGGSELVGHLLLTDIDATS